LAVLYFLARLLTDHAYWPNFRERLGFLPQSFSRTNADSIWLHAVSAGEIGSAIPLIEHLRHDQPLTPIYLSTSTAAGRKAAVHKASSLVDGIFYSPLDYVSCIRRTLRTIRPALLIVLETEIWPHLYSETKRSGARLAIVNGRISNRSWPRYRALKRFFAPILRLPDAVMAQSATDYDRYAELGVSPSKLDRAGNLKYDASFAPASPGIATLDISTCGAEQIWIAASTVGPNERGSLKRHSVDEDDIVLRAFKALAADFPHLLLILAPRQPARFAVVARKLEHSGVRFVRRTAIMKRDPAVKLELPAILLLDTIGELTSLYPFASVAFVGGSVAPRGGHNILEPAAAGVPVIVGPHMENFEAIARDFLEADVIVQIGGEEELSGAVRDLLRDRARAHALADRAHHVVESRRGASRSVVSRLWPLYHSAYPKPVHNLLARSVLGFLAFLWRKGGILKRHRSERYAASVPPLPVPVVSVGGITIGGSGKTPFTAYLAARLSERGCSPAILTRGYRRRSPAQNLVFAPGANAPPAFTGDEAQILLRSGIAPIGIGANRYETAKILLEQFPSTGIFLLDDGFQHARLKRDFDIVLIDGLDPFGQDGVVPLGRLREPLEALARADALIVTRAETDLRYEAICTRLGDYNPSAPVFRARLTTRCWRDYRTGACIQDLSGRRVAAFCGLGNPQSFWRTLESLGLEVVFQWAFRDHHSYQPFELQRIAYQARAHGAEILVTTEKDRINCPSNLEKVIAPLDLAWLEIEMRLENEAAFFACLQQALGCRIGW